MGDLYNCSRRSNLAGLTRARQRPSLEHIHIRMHVHTTFRLRVHGCIRMRCDVQYFADSVGSFAPTQRVDNPPFNSLRTFLSTKRGRYVLPFITGPCMLSG